MNRDTKLRNSFLKVQYSRDKAVYFSSRFHTTVIGMGTEDRNLMRLTVSRCEIDLGNIKAAYQTLYGTSLSNDVAVSHHYIRNLNFNKIFQLHRVHFLMIYVERFFRILSNGFVGFDRLRVR